MKNTKVLKRLMLMQCGFALMASAQMASISIPVRAIRHPVQTFHSVPADRLWMLAGTITFESANGADYATTYRGPILHPGQYCENNPVFVIGRCIVNVPRFTGVKLAGGILGIVEWVPVLAGWKNETYIRTMTVLDFALAVPLAIADVNNIHQLTK